MEQQIRERIGQAIQEKVFPGCVVGVVKKNSERLVLPFGRFTYEGSSPPVKGDSIFDVASITKAIPTSSLALRLIDEGKLNINDKLINIIPAFKGGYRDQVRIRHLLTMTLVFKLNSLSSYKDQPRDEILKIIFGADLKHPPGEAFLYTNSSSILLGIVVERIAGSTLDKLADDYFFKSLEMSRTTFWPLEKFNQEEIVPTENDGWREGDTRGEVHDESAYAFMKSGKAVGSAGLFSTAPDLLNFLEMLQNGGRLKGHRYFSPEIIKEMHTNQIGELGYQGLGWELYQPHYMGKYCTKETFGKTGFTGCVVICDIGKEVGIVILSNTTYPKRKSREMHIETINRVRRDIADIVFSNS